MQYGGKRDQEGTSKASPGKFKIEDPRWLLQHFAVIFHSEQSPPHSRLPRLLSGQTDLKVS